MEVLRGVGNPVPEYDERTRRYFARGHLYGSYVYQQLVAKFGRDDVVRERIVKWPLGEGHMDAYIVSLGMVVETKSTVTPSTSSPMFDMSVEQNKMYQHYTPGSKTGAVYLINPSDLSREDVFTVKLTGEDRDRIDAKTAFIRDAINGEADAPVHGSEYRPCVTPGQARGRMCPFAHVCFQDWQPPDTAENTNPLAVEAARALYQIKQEIREHTKMLDSLEAEKKNVEAELAELVDLGDTVVGPYQVKRTHVVRQPTFSVRAYQAAGLSLEPLAEFFRPGSEYDTWRVTMADTAGSIDYGEEAPF